MEEQPINLKTSELYSWAKDKDGNNYELERQYNRIKLRENRDIINNQIMFDLVYKAFLKDCEIEAFIEL